MLLIQHIPKGIRRLAKRILTSQIPRGLDFCTDIRHWLPNQRVKIIFDVGANIGQTTRDFYMNFPGAYCHSFEPESKNFEILVQNLRRLKRATPHQLAMSDRIGSATLELNDAATMHRLVNQGETEGSTTTVQTTTLDTFCFEQGTRHIDVLKIDTEGHDLKVLEGARELLLNRRIAIIHVEVGIDTSNTRHVPLSTILPFMHASDYRLFAIYEQVHEWPSGRPELRRINAAFISPECSRRNLMASHPAVGA